MACVLRESVPLEPEGPMHISYYRKHLRRSPVQRVGLINCCSGPLKVMKRSDRQPRVCRRIWIIIQMQIWLMSPIPCRQVVENSSGGNLCPVETGKKHCRHSPKVTDLKFTLIKIWIRTPFLCFPGRARNTSIWPNRFTGTSPYFDRNLTIAANCCYP